MTSIKIGPENDAHRLAFQEVGEAELVHVEGGVISMDMDSDDAPTSCRQIVRSQSQLPKYGF